MKNPPVTAARATRLDFADELLAELDLPGGRLRVTRGLGSGLARQPGAARDILWSIGDRGPNLKIPLAVDHYGLTALEAFRDVDGAKLLPCPDIGPAISELRVTGDRVELIRSIPIRGRSGRPISGLPPPFGLAEQDEPALGLDGSLLPADPSGADTEGLAVAPNGDFWVGDEYGPSLFHIAADGMVLRRIVPEGSEGWFVGADYPIEPALPAIAARRRLNRGFEGLAISDDGAWLYLVFQSPLAHPDAEAHRRGRYVRIWKLATATGRVAAQFVYPLDPPRSFLRDKAAGDVDRSDIKVSELALLGDDQLLLLERGSLTTKLYAVRLGAELEMPVEQLELETRPTIEQASLADGMSALPVLVKRLILSTDDHPEIDGDLEGIAILSPRTILLVNDSDFGIEGVETRFWRIDLTEDASAG